MIMLFVLFVPGCLKQQTVETAADVLPRDSFLLLRKTISVYRCGEDAKTSCAPEKYKSLASGFVIETTPDGAFAITAGHVCDTEYDLSKMPNVEARAIYLVSRLDGEQFEARVLSYNSQLDVCMLYVKNLIGVPAVVVSDRAPTPGDKVYNLAAPVGIYRKNMVPIIEGRFNGNASGLAWYSLPAAPGSSGSMIVNSNGELIGMVHSVMIRFPIISLSTKYEDLKAFIDLNLTKFTLYKKVMHELGLEDIFTPLVPLNLDKSKQNSTIVPLHL